MVQLKHEKLGKIIAPSKSRFRSWTIVLVGMLLQAGFGWLLMSKLFEASRMGDAKDAFGGALAGSIAGPILILPAFLGIIPLIFMLFGATRRFGGLLAIIAGVIALGVTGFLVGPFLIFGGVLALTKRI